MSLLLEALKKAEKAKEDAQRRARGETPEALEPERRPVVTRDQLPDVSSELEIESPDFASSPEPTPPPSAERPRSSARSSSAQAASADADAGRATARKAFEAKFREPNPRMPFYLAMGALSVFAVGTVIYFWYQLRPPPPLVNTNPPRPAETVVAAPEAKPAVASAPAAAPAAIPGLPPAAEQAPAVTAPKPPAAAADVPAAKAEPPPAPPKAQAQGAAAKPEPQAAAPKAEPRPSAPRTRASTAPRSASAKPAALPERAVPARPLAQVHPRVQAGYSAYIGGDLAAARTQYEEAVREQPGNRDALLGLAALEVRAGRLESAEALYLRVLHADPRDAEAQAALVTLRAGRSDPLASESRLKSLLASEPGAHTLHFALGNQYAQQGRWAEAQQEYFKAFAAEPDNADFAYNLAVSLDHLRQRRQALEYYQRAIALAEKRGASFEMQSARNRAAQLAR